MTGSQGFKICVTLETNQEKSTHWQIKGEKNDKLILIITERVFGKIISWFFWWIMTFYFIIHLYVLQ